MKGNFTSLMDKAVEKQLRDTKKSKCLWFCYDVKKPQSLEKYDGEVFTKKAK